MNIRTLIFVAIGIGIAISAGVIAYSLILEPEESNFAPQTLDFDYSMNSQLKEALSEQNVSLSSPIKAIQKYCTFFDDPEKQSQIEYCTSTELRDSEGRFLGNVHMVGTPDNPKLVIAILEATFAQADQVSEIFDIVIDNTVCECWEEKKPDNFSSTSEWITALKEFHQQAVSQTTTKSSVLTLDGLKIQSEITSIEGTYVWKLFVAR